MPKQVNQRYKVKTSKSTVHNWMNRYRHLLPDEDWRRTYRKGYGAEPEEEHVFQHGEVDYRFKRHVPKLENAGEQFPGMRDFVRSVEEQCSNELFEEGERSSQLDLGVEADVRETTNLACEYTELALKAVDNRRKRHEAVQDLILACDKATVAVELPIWYYDKHGDRSITGHIDVLQVRNGKIYILDYKPNAEKKEPLTQLYTYASGLSFRTGIPFRRFRAAWFNGDTYREFAPVDAELSP